MGEISTASNEQAQSVEQINKAVVKIDKGILRNAANAEESASAAEEMNGQAKQLRQYVADLVVLMSGDRNVSSTVAPPDRTLLPAQEKGVKPHHIIPLEEKEI